MTALGQSALATRRSHRASANVNARAFVTLYFQAFVDQGNAGWKINRDGITELHMRSGEVFLLKEETLTRLE